MQNLSGRVAIVTGASRSVGKGVALSLAQAGAVVYATGRTITEDSFVAAGRVVPIRCDHTNDTHVEAAFHRVIDDQKHLDILVNSVCGGYENMVENGEFTWPLPF